MNSQSNIMTDSDRLNWLLDYQAFITSFYDKESGKEKWCAHFVGNWHTTPVKGPYRLGEGFTPREAIDDAMRRQGRR